MSKRMTRRRFMKGAAVAAAAVSAGGLLSACASEGESAAPEEQPEEPAQEPAEEPAEQPVEDEASDAAAGGSVLVAYFSATGNTEEIALAMADELGADVFEITPVDPYSEDDLGYNNPDSRTSREREDPNMSIELEQVTPDGFDAYDTVFLGYPIW